jgi:RimJ/RimL family protein N-acetyltransferase
LNEDILTPRLILRLMPEAFLRASLEGDAAAAALGLVTPREWYAERDLMRIRLDTLIENPGYRPWALRAIGLAATGEMIGFVGFHTTPDPAYLQPFAPGGIEFGYTIFAPHRGRGYAQEAARGLVQWAAQAHGIARFIMTISPTNAPSYRIAQKFGFRKIGAHVDEVDGPEDILLLEGEALAALLNGDGDSTRQ